MAYYVSIMNESGSKRVLAAGPFKRHGDALHAVDAVRRLTHERYPREAPWVAYGTCHHKTSHTAPTRFEVDELDLVRWGSDGGAA